MANETIVKSAWWVRAIALLPLPVLHAIARGLAFLALNVLPYRPKVIRANLSTAFPQWDARTLRRTMRDFYRGYADVMLELLKAARLEPEELRRRMRLVNPELLHAEIDAGRPVVLFAAHQCNWEWILLALSIEGLPVDCAYKPLVNEWANREMHALRTRFGARMVAVDDMMRDVQTVNEIMSHSAGELSNVTHEVESSVNTAVTTLQFQDMVRQLLAHVTRGLVDAVEEAVGEYHVQHGVADGRGERIAAEGGAVGPELHALGGFVREIGRAHV